MLGKQEAIMADARAFMKSRVILTAASLDFFTRLHEKALSAEDLAAELRLDPVATRRVLDCLAGFGLLQKANDRYSVSDQGRFYSAHHAESVLPMIKHLDGLWDKWGRLTEIVQKGARTDREAGIQMDDRDWKAFIGAMHVVGRELSERIAEEYDPSGFKRLLDIGGASGTYTMAFLTRQPQMRAVIFDLEHVIPMARERLTAAGLQNRVELVAGDFYRDELPHGCDLALLSAIIHQNSVEENIGLYRKIYRALEPGGKILIRDYIMDETRTQPPPGTLFDINMLVGTRGGRTYTFSEVEDGLRKAGFENPKLARRGEGMDSLVEARKSGR